MNNNNKEYKLSCLSCESAGKKYLIGKQIKPLLKCMNFELLSKRFVYVTNILSDSKPIC